MAVNFLAQIWGMALLCMNNDVHMWLLFILYSLKLPFPSKTFPGQVFNYICLGGRKSLSAEQLLPLILLCLEGNRSAGWLQGGSRDLLRVPRPQCHVPSAELPPKRYSSPLQQCQQGGDWSPAPEQASADVEEVRDGVLGTDCTKSFSCQHWGRRRDMAAGGRHGPTPHPYPSLEVGTQGTTQKPKFVHANRCIIRSSQKNSPFPRKP